MRICSLHAWALCVIGVSAAASPAWGQSASKVPGPRTILPAHVMCAPLPVSSVPVPTLRVKGGHRVDGRIALAKGDVVVLGRSAADGLAVGQRYIVRRLPTGADAYLRTGDGFASIKTSGWITITAIDDLNALAHIDHSCDTVEPGDYLEPLIEPLLPTGGSVLSAPDFLERIQILAGTDGRTTFADGDTFSIARGLDHGVVSGARYAIYRDPRDGRPLVHIGEAIVAEPTGPTAKLLLVTTRDAVFTYDVAVPRRAPR